LIRKISTNHFAIIAALFLSCVSGYFSVTGMSLLFSGASISVIIMASALEFSKIVSAAWLQHNWKTASYLIRTYLIIATCFLVLLTSMGTFGYLSRAHLATSDNIQLSQLQIQPLQDQINQEQRKLKNAQTSLDTLDRFANTSDPKDAVFIRARQKTERQHINTEISDATGKLEILNSKLLPLKTQQAITTSDIGPLKYISELIYGKSASEHFDETVRFVIILIVIVFDPLAIVLLLAGTSGLNKKQIEQPIKRGPGRPKKEKVIEIPENSIINFVMDD